MPDPAHGGLAGIAEVDVGEKACYEGGPVFDTLQRSDDRVAYGPVKIVRAVSEGYADVVVVCADCPHAVDGEPLANWLEREAPWLGTRNKSKPSGCSARSRARRRCCALRCELKKRRADQPHFMRRDPTNDAAPTDAQLTVPYDTIVRLVIAPSAGGFPTAPATVYLLSHSALVSLFKRPAEYDTQSWLVTNATTQSVDLALKDPTESVTLPAASLSRVYYRIVNPSNTLGVAEVKLILVPIP